VTLLAQIPGGSLSPSDIARFVTPLLVPPAMPQAGIASTRDGQTVDHYEIAVRQFPQQVLPADLPPTTVWGYGPRVAQSGPQIFNAPSLTIEARVGTPVRITWVNELVDADGRYLPHLLPVDQTLHWVNPPGGVNGRDTRPTFSQTPGTYTGPVPIVTHVHGAASVGDESDGYAEAWYLPAATNLPLRIRVKARGTAFWRPRPPGAASAARGPVDGGRARPCASTPTPSARARPGTTTTPWA
jgi:hypothetical protein